MRSSGRGVLVWRGRRGRWCGGGRGCGAPRCGSGVEPQATRPTAAAQASNRNLRVLAIVHPKVTGPPRGRWTRNLQFETAIDAQPAARRRRGVAMDAQPAARRRRGVAMDTQPAARRASVGHTAVRRHEGTTQGAVRHPPTPVTTPAIPSRKNRPGQHTLARSPPGRTRPTAPRSAHRRRRTAGRRSSRARSRPARRPAAPRAAGCRNPRRCRSAPGPRR
jgi:hypothetical protein